MKMIIPHSKPTLGIDEQEAVTAVIKSGQISQGPKVKESEDKFAKFIGRQGGVAASSGTAALHLALLCLGIGKGDEVIIPSYVCTAVLNAVNYCGAKPRLADIEEDYNISFSDTKRKINRKTKAIIVPHLFGLPARMEKFCSLDIPIVEDCAQSLGAEYMGRTVGKWGTISIFSFYATKMMTTGEGGMLLSDSSEILKRAKDYRDYDERIKFKVRYNYKMTDIEAALGLVQMKRVPEFVRERRHIASIYNKEFFKSPCYNPDNIFYRYIIKVRRDINGVIEKLRRKGIECRRPVFKPLHSYLGIKGFPNTTRAWQTALSIPIYPSLRNEDVERIITGVKRLSENMSLFIPSY